MKVRSLCENFTGGGVRRILGLAGDDLEDVTEIRIRIHKPLIIKRRSYEYFIKTDGSLEQGQAGSQMPSAYCPDREDIQKTMELMSNYSLYAFEDEIRNGYITLPGGHRVGLCGQAVVEGGCVKTIRHLNGFTIRITHEIKGCGAGVIGHIALPSLRHTMVISPPGCGKTTLLRDIIRILSMGDRKLGISGRTVGVADERSEIAGCYQSVPQNDVGIRTDVMDGAPKAQSMRMLLRSMSPEIIAADEIGRIEDVAAIDEMIHSGVKLLCTAHGASVDELRGKDVLAQLLAKDIIERFIVLKGGGRPGVIEGIYDNLGRRINNGGVESP